MSSNYDALKLSVEASMPNNTVLFDDKGMPSIVVKVPKFKISDVITGGSSATHPAFIVNGVEKDAIYISKYQNIVVGDRAYSLPMQDPRAYVNFDQAKQYCENKGAGWHLMTNAEWAAIALWCVKNGFMPRGNNNYGADHSAPHETGVQTFPADATRTGRVATGSGPVTWAHNNDGSGIYDLNGNVWEWVGGYRTNNGEINVLPNNDAAITGADQSVSSTRWRAINEAGAYVTPGTAGTLKYDAPFKLSKTVTGTGQANALFQAMTKDESIATVPEVLKALGLFPAGSSLGDDRFYVDVTGERLACRGGHWARTSYAGVFALDGNYSRTGSTPSFGFRSAFVE